MPKEKLITPLQYQGYDDILVHYYPGNRSAPTQATRYIGEDDELRLPTGERASSSIKGIPLFEARHFYFPKMEEIEINQGQSFGARVRHWFKSIPSIIKHWWNGITLVNSKEKTDTNDSYKRFAINSNKSSLGQQTDINEFLRSNQDIRHSSLSEKKRVYFGVSRGAAATFSALAEAEMNTVQNIKLCILEAPPSSLSTVFKYYGERYFKSRAVGKWVYHKLATFFLGAQHKTDKASQARGHVDAFPNHVPLLIISSKKDTTVPHESSIRLAFRLAEKRSQAKKRGEMDVAPLYFLQLEHVDHDYYATSDSEDSLRYRNTVHAICRKHGLPFISEYAEAGEDEMQKASLLDLGYQPFIELQRQFWNTKDNSARINMRETARQQLDRQSRESKVDQYDYAQRIESILHHTPLFAKQLKPSRPNSDRSMDNEETMREQKHTVVSSYS